MLARDQFVKDLRDVSLRRELKSLVRQRPLISFLELRREAIRWVEEGEKIPGHTRAGLHHCGADVNVDGACHVVRGGNGSELSVLTI